MNEIKRGDIYYADMYPTVGSEQGGIRPVIILQNDVGNRYSPTTIVAALTTKQEKSKLPTHVTVAENIMKKESLVLLEQIKTIDKSRLRKYIGHMDSETMKSIDKALAVSFGIKCMD